ncbi:MAG: hypothetical protein QOH71_694 [Blastocatellia bacterium]|nr:hypothetical protein [Blastocatellia bacterium]
MPNILQVDTRKVFRDSSDRRRFFHSGVPVKKESYLWRRLKFGQILQKVPDIGVETGLGNAADFDIHSYMHVLVIEREELPRSA